MLQVHELSRQMGLKSKSYGKGEERRVVVSKVSGGGGLSAMMGSLDANEGGKKKKKREEGALPTEAEYRRVPRINVGRRGAEALRGHLRRFPPTEQEEAEARETGASLASSTADGTDPGRTGVGAGDAERGASHEHAAAPRTPGKHDATLLTLDDLLAPPAPAVPAAEPLPATSRHTLADDDRGDRRRRHGQTRERQTQQRIQDHRRAQQRTRAHPKYAQMMQQRRKLPAFGYARDICDVLRDPTNRVVILTGDTGCGYVYRERVSRPLSFGDAVFLWGRSNYDPVAVVAM